MRLFNCILKRSSNGIPKGTNVEIINSGIPSKTDIREAVERKYGVRISDNDISTINWEREEIK
ncbi:hypothetical protein [Tenacibaculum ovolyticum]|uniref:hypothetical protein n=1 Tax=Tenacibaculum ovolyticum TaxID=104270 RepID=UPI001F25B33B|nr:hypothetical protein [Tenacibaculum ovolyticum]